MHFLKTFSGKVLLLTGFVFMLSTFQGLNRLKTDEWRCINVADGFGYYMYLPHLFNEGSLYMTQEWAQDLQDKYCEGCYAYQLSMRKNGNQLDIYHMGLSYILLPSYAIGDAIAHIMGYSMDGFSTPYHVVYLLNALLFIFLGLFYLRKLLLLFVGHRVAGYAILMLYFGTNVYSTFQLQFDLPHLYLFTLNTLFLYHTLTYLSTQQRQKLIYAALFFGLTTAIRPTQAIFGLIPLLLLLRKFGNTSQFWKSILFFPLFSLLWNIPQILYWTIVGGELITLNLHTEDIVLTDPNLLDFLFSYRKGWLIYSPLFLILPFGFYRLLNQNRNQFWAFLSFTLLYIYVLSSWETWFYANSFGSRVMVDIYPLLIVVIAIGINKLKSKLAIGTITLFVLICTGLNLFQDFQLKKGYLHTERMSKEHYWYIFGRSKIDNYNESRLLIDRTSLNWLEYQKELRSPKRYIRSRKIFSIEKPMYSTPTEDLTLGRINILELIKTDETMFEVKMRVKTTDNTKSSILRMECVSPYNVYGWQSLELSQLRKTNNEFEEVIFKFNLPDIRHKKDEMQIYLDNDANVSVTMQEMTIIAHSLIRK